MKARLKNAVRIAAVLMSMPAVVGATDTVLDQRNESSNLRPGVNIAVEPPLATVEITANLPVWSDADSTAAEAEAIWDGVVLRYRTMARHAPDFADAAGRIESLMQELERTLAGSPEAQALEQDSEGNEYGVWVETGEEGDGIDTTSESVQDLKRASGGAEHAATVLKSLESILESDGADGSRGAEPATPSDSERLWTASPLTAPIDIPQESQISVDLARIARTLRDAAREIDAVLAPQTYRPDVSVENEVTGGRHAVR